VQPGAALFGPAITVAKTGNIYQAGFSYTSNKIVKEKLGISPLSYVSEILTQDNIKDDSSILTQDHKKNNLSVSTQDSEKNDLDASIKSKKISNNKKLTLNYNNVQNDHKNFLIAVKKLLK
tara:strand:+ start:197 stop:559 length:363 start_codon:yes stop_codon:yes gene_type:complete